jgi:pyruvate dehydrogenase E2 component (dihydrolipoamide acetyltransferase)
LRKLKIKSKKCYLKEFKMAKISEMTQLSPTMTEGLIVKWLKQVGDKVGPGDIIAEVETDKAVMEMEAYDKGTILSIIANEGTKVKVGLPVAIIGKDGEDISILEQEAKSKLNSAPKAKDVPKPVETPKVEEPKKIEVKLEEKPTVVISKTETPKLEKRTDGRVHASPLAKSIALAKGIDITKVVGSGPEGRITKTDVLNFISNPVSNNFTSSFSVPNKPERKIEITGMRKVIATRLHDAKNNIPHFYLNLEFDAEPLVKMRELLNKDLKSLAERKNEKPDLVSINDFIIKACSIALVRIPEVNSSWREDHILEHGRVDIGIAVSVDGGLITPYVRNADKLSLVEVHSEIKSLAEKARNRKLKPTEFTDGTFTISNLGMFGITSFSAIINEPEAALLAVGGLIEKALVKNGSIVSGKTITVTLSCDHRVVDGAIGAKFLGEFKEIVEHPYTIIR